MIRATEDPLLAARVVTTTPMPGLTSGSALLHLDGGLLAVHDDAFRVSRITLPALDVTPFVLVGDGAPLAKSRKPDFESAVLVADGTLHLLGSGSRANRCAFVRIDLRARVVSFADRPDVFRCVQEALASAERPNIEGAVADGERLRLFHRGIRNGPSAIVDVPLAVLDGAAPAALGTQTFELGELDRIRLGFTDAAQVSRGRTVYVAAAEDAADAVADGPVSGSVIGLIESIGGNRDRTSARWTRLVDAGGDLWPYKVEGVAIDDDLRGAWILTDPDDPARSTVLGRVELRGFE